MSTSYRRLYESEDSWPQARHLNIRPICLYASNTASRCPFFTVFQVWLLLYSVQRRPVHVWMMQKHTFMIHEWPIYFLALSTFLCSNSNQGSFKSYLKPTHKWNAHVSCTYPFECTKEIICIFKFTIHFTLASMLSRISTSILQSAQRTIKDIVNGIWSVFIFTFALLHCCDTTSCSHHRHS